MTSPNTAIKFPYTARLRSDVPLKHSPRHMHAISYHTRSRLRFRSQTMSQYVSFTCILLYLTLFPRPLTRCLITGHVLPSPRHLCCTALCHIILGSRNSIHSLIFHVIAIIFSLLITGPLGNLLMVYFYYFTCTHSDFIVKYSCILYKYSEYSNTIYIGSLPFSLLVRFILQHTDPSEWQYRSLLCDLVIRPIRGFPIFPIGIPSHSLVRGGSSCR